MSSAVMSSDLISVFPFAVASLSSSSLIDLTSVSLMMTTWSFFVLTWFTTGSETLRCCCCCCCE